MAQREIAILLTGCGVHDGTDIHEAFACKAAVTAVGFLPVFYSLDKDQAEVINHLVPAVMTSCSEDDKKTCSRNMFVESARIVGGRPNLLEELDMSVTYGLLIPGGGGILKNISNILSFVKKEPSLQVDEDVVSFLNQFHEAHKPIGAISHGILLLAAVFKDVEVTFGEADESGFSDIAELLGAKVIGSTGVHLDTSNNLLSTPGSIDESLEVAMSINQLIEKMMDLIDSSL
ncbi:uncharacterized protein LOC111709596 isoform X2 [Eurytemora carolleeae]|uniref:uncharacterized protein LOC111709596 isoform X2 n=1 Tax=Eurytemora carolleeae TaxID=1294199 RepID=UPI000C7707B9|nr:uncharacterized protein LOC111709596 isoform X2 [Eurytemora carolleeae]|eukprot:XP_023339100.1 uncharacterized protein LOC111709596 isoform X2 [Eurytemora affinis]